MLCETLRSLADHDELTQAGPLARIYGWFFRSGTWVEKHERGDGCTTLSMRRRRVVRGADSEIVLEIRDKPGGGCSIQGRIRMLYQSWIPLLLFPLAFVLARLSDPTIDDHLGLPIAAVCGVLWILYVINRENLFRSTCEAGQLLVTKE